MSAQLLNSRNSAEHRLSSCGELQNSLVTLIEESSVFILNVDDRSGASLIDRSGNENRRQQGSVAASSGHGQVELGHDVLLPGRGHKEVYDWEIIIWRGSHYRDWGPAV